MTGFYDDVCVERRLVIGYCGKMDRWCDVGMISSMVV